MPHFEKVTQIKTDYPRISVPGGQYGVIYARKTKRHRRLPFPLSEPKAERKSNHPEQNAV
jgi:hypothetical protein